MTQVVKYTKQHNRYLFSGSNDAALNNLGNFLTADLGLHSWQSFKVWAQDELQSACSANISHLLKTKEGILIGNLYTQDPDYYLLSHHVFINLIEQWQTLPHDAIAQFYLIEHEQHLQLLWVDLNDQEQNVLISK